MKEEKVEAAKYENEQVRKHLEAKNEKLVVQQARLQEGLRRYECCFRLGRFRNPFENFKTVKIIFDQLLLQ